MFDRLLKWWSYRIWRLHHPEKWDLSEMRFGRAEFKNAEDFRSKYKGYEIWLRYSNGIDIIFEGDTFKVINIVGYTRSGICRIAFHGPSLIRSLKGFK